MTQTTASPARHVPDGLPTHLTHYIDGELRDSVGGAHLRGARPGLQHDLRHGRRGPGRGRRRRGAGRARRVPRRSVADAWPPRARARVLNRIADLVEARDARLAELESFDTGLPITQALGQAQRAAENFRFFADLIVAQTDDAYQVPGRQFNYVNRKPVGVAGLITPWNTPFMLESWKLAPALASGCTRGAQAGRVHPALRELVGGDLRRGGAAAGRVQPRQRHRRGGRRRRWSSTPAPG